MVKIYSENFNIFDLNSNKIFFVENSAREIIIEENGHFINIEDYLNSRVNVTDSILRATCVVTFGKCDMSKVLKDTKELYNFLVEDATVSFRVDFPKEVSIFDIKTLCVEI